MTVFSYMCGTEIDRSVDPRLPHFSFSRVLVVTLCTISCSVLDISHHFGVACVCVVRQMPSVKTQLNHRAEDLLWRLFTINKVIRDNSLLLFPVKHSWMLQALSLCRSLPLWTCVLCVCVRMLVCICVYTPLTVILAYLTELWPSLLDNYSKWVSLF